MRDTKPSYKETVSHILGKYEYRRGPQAKTVIRQMRQQQQRPTIPSNSVYPKILEGLWLDITQDNSVYEPSVVHGEDCYKINCKCTPVPRGGPAS